MEGYLDSVYPKYKEKARERYRELELMLKELETAIGGVRKVSFPVVLNLATSK